MSENNRRNISTMRKTAVAARAAPTARCGVRVPGAPSHAPLSPTAVDTHGGRTRVPAPSRYRTVLSINCTAQGASTPCLGHDSGLLRVSASSSARKKLTLPRRDQVAFF
jgi:hypothetical protein